MTQDLKALVRFPEKYFEAHMAIRRLRPDDFFDQRKTHVRDTFENFKFNGEKDSMLRVLAVGSSNGISDIPIIDTLDSKYSGIYYIAVEPSESQIQQFEHLVKSKQEAGLWKNTKFAFHPTTIEEYLKKREPGGFDIVHLQHSAYHLADPESVIVELYGQLNKGGMLFTTLVVGAWEKIYLRMGTIVPDPILPNFGSATLRDMLQRRIPDVKIQTRQRKSTFKIDECFKEESKDGNLMLDFLVQVHDFRKTAPREVFGDFMKFLRECCEELNDELYFPYADESIVVIKE